MNIKTKKAFDKDKVFLMPEEIFNSPDEVLLCGLLTSAEKLTVLKNWKDQYIQLEKATNEGMGPGLKSNMLKDISDTIDKI